jgi:DNA-binding transcriptional LysR family regulator
VQLDTQRYDMLLLGRERIAPYARCDRQGKPEFTLPGARDRPLPFLSYGQNAYLGRMVEMILADAKKPLHLDKRYETDMAEGLKMMALNGHGIAFLPESAVQTEVRAKKLAPATPAAQADAAWSVEMEIRLYREKPSPARPGKRAALALWDYLAGKGVGSKVAKSAAAQSSPAKVMPKKHKAMKT